MTRTRRARCDVRNRVGVIRDVHYRPCPIAPARLADLSNVNLRSVSPLCIQYLKNMGVAASASISIVRHERARSGSRTGFGKRMLDPMVKRIDGTIRKSDNVPARSAGQPGMAPAALA